MPAQATNKHHTWIANIALAVFLLAGVLSLAPRSPAGAQQPSPSAANPTPAAGALAAQETVKNFFGGVTLIADQPVRVGDLCRFGDKTGTVEDISLWSTRVRTPDRTVISIPNAQFASMQLENFARRDRIRLATAIGLHTDTTAEQVRHVLAELTTLLREHPKIDASTARAQLCGFGNAAFRMEISAYVLTADFQEYAAIREDLFLRIMDIVGGSGSKFGTLG